MPVRHFTLPPVPDLLGEPSIEEEQQVADDPSEGIVGRVVYSDTVPV